jgi:O-antigen/teichoic acid export membrane protein
MTDSNRFGNGVIWSYFQSWAARGITTFSFLIVGLIVGPEEFGLYALVSSLLVMAEMLCEQALSQTVVQTQMKDARELSTVFWIAIGAGLLISSGLLLASLSLDSVFNSHEIPSLLVWAAICPIIVGTTAVPIGLLRRELDFKALTKRTILASGVSSTVGVGLVVFGFGARGLVAQSIIYYLVGAAVLWRNCEWRPACVINRPTAVHICKLGLANASNKILDFAETRGVEIAIGAFAGIQAMGVYAFANKVAQTAFQTLVSPVIEVVFAGIARGNESLLSTLRNGQLIIAIVPVAGLFFLAASAKPLLSLAYGDRWEAAAMPLSVLVLAYALRSYLYCFGVALQASGRYKTSLRLSAFRVAICMIIAFLLLAAVDRSDLVAFAYLVSAAISMPMFASAVASSSNTPIETVLEIPKLTFWAFLLSAMPLVIVFFGELLAQDNSFAYLTIAVLSGVIFFAMNLKLNRTLITSIALKSGNGRFSSVLRKATFIYTNLGPS